MLVTFKNTGMVEEADIRFDGLTVIAGENDTGKSTIGKIIYSVIKTFNRFERDARAYQAQRIQGLIDDYYFDTRKKTGNPAIHAGIKTFFDELKNYALGLLGKTIAKEEILSTLAGKITGFAGTMDSTFGVHLKFEGIQDKLVNYLLEKPSKEEIFAASFHNYIDDVLSGEVSNKFAAEHRYFIKGVEGENIIFEISGSNGDVEVRSRDKLYFEDATFIESPILINLADNIRFSKTGFDRGGDTKKQAGLLEKAYAPEYIRDFILKLTDRKTRGKSVSIADKIREIIGGDFYYDDEEMNFIFAKSNETFKGVSIASGIKYLGAVCILFLSGFIGPKALLVIDEPETHMHPQWQIRFADILVQLVKEGGNILLTSHSPYFLEAVKTYSDRYLLKGKAAFYFSRKVPHLINNKSFGLTSQIGNVTHDLSPIFETLAVPFRELERLQARDIA
jgi:hypothetical protein